MLPVDLGKYCHSCYFWVLPLLQSGPVKRWFSSSESLIQAFCSYVWLMKHSHLRNNNCKGFGGNSYWALAFAIWESDRDRCRVSHLQSLLCAHIASTTDGQEKYNVRRRCNFKFSDSHMRKLKRSQRNWFSNMLFNSIYLVLTNNQGKFINEMFYMIFFHIRSLKLNVHSLGTAYLN